MKPNELHKKAAFQRPHPQKSHQTHQKQPVKPTKTIPTQAAFDPKQKNLNQKNHLKNLNQKTSTKKNLPKKPPTAPNRRGVPAQRGLAHVSAAAALPGLPDVARVAVALAGEVLPGAAGDLGGGLEELGGFMVFGGRLLFLVIEVF